MENRIKKKLSALKNKFKKQEFNSKDYWIKRYEAGGNSGLGSYDKLAQFKADVLNSFIKKYNIRSVIEFGCGDGNQLKFLERIPYHGFDVSPVAIQICAEKFVGDNNKKFGLIEGYMGEMAELTLSLDVIYHVTEYQNYLDYMTRLFSASKRYVVIYSSNFDDSEVNMNTHILHREFTSWINSNAQNFQLIDIIRNPFTTESCADFYFYEKVE